MSFANESNETADYFDSDEPTDEELRSEILYEFIMNGILLNVVGVLGIMGNVISMIILTRPQMKSSINYLLTGLARCDTVLILTSVFLFGIPAVYKYCRTPFLVGYYFKIYPFLCAVVYPIALMTQTVSVYLTLTVTLERFVAVCHPLQARSLCTYGRARIYVVLIIVFSIIYNISRFWEVSIEEDYNPELNMTIYTPVPSTLRNNHLYISIYIHWLYLFFIYFFPFTCLAILNTAIYRQGSWTYVRIGDPHVYAKYLHLLKTALTLEGHELPIYKEPLLSVQSLSSVRKANRERQKLSRLQKKEIGLATMLLCVVVVFFICNILALIANVLEAFYGLIVDRMVKTSNLLVTINSSVNFIIYVIFGEKFKRLFIKLFCTHGPICGHGRESPECNTFHEESIVLSNGGETRYSIRATNGRGSSKQVPCVYYPARTRSERWNNELTTTTSLNSGGSKFY